MGMGDFAAKLGLLPLYPVLISVATVVPASVRPDKLHYTFKTQLSRVSLLTKGAGT